MLRASLLIAALLTVVACSGPAVPPETSQPRAARALAAPALEAPRGSGAATVDPGTAVPVSAEDPSWGKADAPVTFVVWGDYQCPFTAKLMATLAPLKERYGPASLRIVWKHFPLPFHEEAHPAAVVAETVLRLGGNEAFWRFHETVLSNQARLSWDNLLVWAVDAGVAARELEAGLGSRRFEGKVLEDIELGKRSGVTGTPSSIVNGVFISGAQAVDRLVTVIDEQAAEAIALERSGVPRRRLYAEASQRNMARRAVAAPSKSADKDTTTVWRVPVTGAAARGASAPLVTLVMFGDFECAFCAKAIATVDRLERKYAGKLRLVFRHNPLPFHPRAEPAAQLALEARAQKGEQGFWQAYELLFAHPAELEETHLRQYAATLGLDAARAWKAIETRKHQAAIEQDQDLADELDASGTPHFFINGRRVVGAQPVSSFEAIIDEEIAKAERLVASGTLATRVYETLQKDARVKVAQRVLVPAATAAQPAKGPRGATVTIQMFSDFQCPFCKRVQPTLDELIAAFPGKVRVVWRHLPLPMHRQAMIAAEAAEEAFRQKGDKGFWAMAALLLEDSSQAALERPALTHMARKVGLDMRAFDAALDSGRHRAKIEADSKAAADAGITGTPGFAINDYFLSGVRPLPAFKRLVRRALGPREPPPPGSVLGTAPPPA